MSEEGETNQGDRETPTDPVPTLDTVLSEFQAAVAEANALSILAREASKKCTDVSIRLLQEVRNLEGKHVKLLNRVARIEERLGL